MSRLIVKNVTGGTELLWRHISIKKSLDNICHTLEMEIPGSERAKVHKHEKIEVRYENSLIKDSEGRRRIATVMIDEITAGADVSKHSVTVMGRSPARDIVDSTWGGDNDGSLRDNTLYQVLKHICAKFGIACGIIPDDQGDITDPVAIFSWENESPWSKLIIEAAGQGFLLSSNEAGGLYLWKAGIRREGFLLTEGRNIKTIEWEENGAGQYHEYVITGGGYAVFREAGDVEVYAAGSGGVKIIAEDGTLYFANGKNNMAKILTGLIDEIKALVTTGAPPTHTVNGASKQKLEAYKDKIKELYAEAE